MNENYIVVELQKNNGELSYLATVHTSLQDAKHKFYTVAAAASISGLERHSVVIIDEKGELIGSLTV